MGVFSKIKESVIRARIKNAAETLNVADDFKVMCETLIDEFSKSVKDVYAILPVIESVIKDNANEIADVVVACDKIASSIQVVVKNAKSDGNVKKFTNATKGMDAEELNKKLTPFADRINDNFEKVQKILNPGKSKIKKEADEDEKETVLHDIEGEIERTGKLKLSEQISSTFRKVELIKRLKDLS